MGCIFFCWQRQDPESSPSCCRKWVTKEGSLFSTLLPFPHCDSGWTKGTCSLMRCQSWRKSTADKNGISQVVWHFLQVFLLFLFVCCCVITIFLLNEAISYVFCLVFFFWKFFLNDLFSWFDFFRRRERATISSIVFKNTFRYSYLYCWRGSFANYYSFFSLITQCEKSAKKKWFILGGDCMGVTRGGGIA